MNIVILTKKYGKGITGATTSTYNLIDRWVKMGAHVTVLTLKVLGKENNNVEVHKFSNVTQLRRVLKNFKGKKIVGYSDDHLGFFFSLNSIHYIHTYHGNWPQAMFHTEFSGLVKGLWFIPQYILTIKNANMIGCVSKFSTRFVKRFNSKYRIIRNGVNVHPIERHQDLKLNRKINIIMVGGVDSRKYEKLLNLLECLNDESKKKISIDIYGKINDENLAGQLNDTGLVTFKGFKAKVPYAKYHLFLSTSKAENLSIASIEAIVSGIPMLGFSVGGMTEVVKNGENGYLVENGNMDKMCVTLNNILNGSLKFEFDNRKVIKSFSWRDGAKKYFEEFKEIDQEYKISEDN